MADETTPQQSRTTAPATPNPAPAASVTPPPNAPIPSAAPGGGLSADEERQLGDLIAKRDSAAGTEDVAEFKVEEPHESMTHAGVTVGSEYTRVPAHLVPAVTEAAASAGVKLTQREA